MKKLLIVESPAKIKTISKFLGKEFRIMSTLGHIKDLPARKLGITMNGSIELDYEVLDKKEKIIADICKEASNSDDIYLATDPDREGEIISWHVEQEVEKVVKNPDNIHRITFNEITKTAILEAIQNNSKVDLAKVAAQQARRILDRWVGYEVSPVLWRKIKKGLSAGRVQSVALRIICQREEQIRDFKPEEYWSIEGSFRHNPKAVIQAALSHIGKKKAEIKNEAEAKEAVAGIKQASFSITSIEDKTRLKNAQPPFMTSTLQQAAYNQLGFSVKKTMDVAQKLYEGMPLNDPSSPIALITYMRTDSLRIADSALAQTRTFIGNNFSKEYLPPKALVYAKSKGQDAHEACRPVDVTVTPEQVKPYLPADAYKLYTLIWRRFVACQMKAAQYAQRQVTLVGDKYTFKVTGSTLIFDGFLKVYNDDSEDKDEKTVILPADIKEKDPVTLEKTSPKQHFTQAPPRYTEASIVKEMEKEGIGRPSTYSATLNTIQAREYVERDKKKFVPTELGMAVTKMLVENLPKIMDIKFTAHMEEDLDKIAEGSLERDKLLREFYKDFSTDLEKFAGEAGKKAEITDLDCPNCGTHKLAIRFGKTGSFLGCTGFPECSFTSNFKRAEDGAITLVTQEAPQLLEEQCPQCKKPLRKVSGKFGEFVACSGYPECKYIHQEKASFKCPQCGKGEVAKRTWRGGTMWGCTKYPACKFAIFSDIIEEACPICKLPFLAKKTLASGQTIIQCSSKECGYKR